MKFYADLHVHSRFSRATARNLDLENLHIAAQLKGITVVATGDFTHPGWFAELKQKLVPAEPGLYRLRDDLAAVCDQQVPATCHGPVRFMLVSEISNIYKKNGQTRKNHNLVFVPDLDIGAALNGRLDKIGNLKSDGRPILGLDARNLLEIVLETSSQAFLIPAHVWTPWFSLLGSKSGFDSVEDCFEDLSAHIFALETGLSSDPAMNRRVSALDRMTLVSNSDAHSPLKLGREANIFDTELTYDAIRSALESGDPERFKGTIEFYPEEGKYHLDGHRKCNVRLWPEVTRRHKGRCPECGKPLTLGVLYRVEALADRPPGAGPEPAQPFDNLIPLTEILAEILKVGPGSKKVMASYRQLLEKIGSEFKILHQLPIEALQAAGIPLLGPAIERMRHNKIVMLPGFDGEFGTIKIFDDQERTRLLGQNTLFAVPHLAPEVAAPTPPPPAANERPLVSTAVTSPAVDPAELNSEQRRAVECPAGPLLIVAGPGTGKTRTLTHRIAHFMIAQKVPAEEILAVTFTNRAAEEMRARLAVLLGSEAGPGPWVGTIHGLCAGLLAEYHGRAPQIIAAADQQRLVQDAVMLAGRHPALVSLKPQELLSRISSAKQFLLPPENPDTFDGPDARALAAVYHHYQDLLGFQDLRDYDDLLVETVRLLGDDQDFCAGLRRRFQHLFIDEYQDINYAQYRLVTALAPPGAAGRSLCVIGDPDQSIYGFRGSDAAYFKRFGQDYPDAEVVYLTRNYRSTQAILDVSGRVMDAAGVNTRLYSQVAGAASVTVVEAASEKAEAVAIGRTIEQLVGGMGFPSLDFDRVDDRRVAQTFGLADFAVLFRTRDQARVVADVFEAAGIPFQQAIKSSIYDAQGVAELMSLLKVVSGAGTFADFERIQGLVFPRLGAALLAAFKNWSYAQRYALDKALYHVRRLPVAELGKGRQTRLSDAGSYLAALKKQLAGLSVEQQLLALVKAVGRENAMCGTAVNGLLEIGRSCGADSTAWLTRVALQSDTDLFAPQAEKVALMTMHAAKGLEFPVVFVAGCEDGFLPYKRSGGTEADLAEERRLFYVAMTRAQQRLYLSCARRRRVYGRVEQRALSPFVREIEDHLQHNRPAGAQRPAKSGQKQIKLFS